MTLDNHHTKSNNESRNNIDLRYIREGSFVQIFKGNEVYSAILINKDKKNSLEIMPIHIGLLKKAQRQINADLEKKDIADYLNVTIPYSGNGTLRKYEPSNEEFKKIKNLIDSNFHGDLQKYLSVYLDRAKILTDNQKHLPKNPTKIMGGRNSNNHKDKILIEQQDLNIVQKSILANIGKNITENEVDSLESIEREIAIEEEINIQKQITIDNASKDIASVIIEEDKKKKIKDRIKKKEEIKQILEQLNKIPDVKPQWEYFHKKNKENIEIELRKHSVIKLPETKKDVADDWLEYNTPLLSQSAKEEILKQAREDAYLDIEKQNDQQYYFANRAQEVLSYFNNSKVIKLFFDEEFRSVEQACLKLTNLNWETQQHQINYAKRQINKLSWVRDFEKELKIVFEGRGMTELCHKSNQAIASFLQPLMSGKYSSQEATDRWVMGKFKLLEKIKQIEYQEKKNKLINDRDFEVRVIEQTAEVKKELVNLEYNRKLNEVKKEEPKKTSWWQKAVTGVKNFFKR